MNKAYARIFTLSILCFMCETASSLVLTDDNLIQTIKNQSSTYKEVENRALSSELFYEQSYAPFRFTLGLDVSKEKDKTESVSTFTALDSDKDKYTFLLNKRFLTGTLATLELSRINYSSAVSNAEYSQNYYTLSLEQNLFPFIFANQDNLNIKALKKDSQRIELQTDVDLLDTTKDIVSLYWRTKAIQKSVQENADILKKYEKLVSTVKRKKQNSYASAGELEQALAEYETRKQTWSEDSNTLQTNLQLLKAALNIPAEQNLAIDDTTTNKKAIQALPVAYTGDVKVLRRYQIQKLKTESANDSYSAASYKGSARVSAYGKFTSQGLDQSASESFNELQDDPQNKYLIGLKLDYILGDEASQKEKQLKQATQEIESSRFARYENDLKLQIDNSYQKLQNAFANLKTTENVLKYRTEAVKQLSVNFGQGRTDISFLIDAFNKKITAEVAVITAIGNYSTTLIEYQNLVQ